ncbi:hypothetical protein BJY01DRAFT_78755 [Aspergillus pseudoustus]|uniref:Uncharacterized protein n=1 Tax=Aspergillus pseudoustus TaxID=1810923 RepID=A0ABR4KN71_9EURO
MSQETPWYALQAHLRFKGRRIQWMVQHSSKNPNEGTHDLTTPRPPPISELLILRTTEQSQKPRKLIEQQAKALVSSDLISGSENDSTILRSTNPPGDPIGSQRTQSMYYSSDSRMHSQLSSLDTSEQEHVLHRSPMRLFDWMWMSASIQDFPIISRLKRLWLTRQPISLMWRS